jgi:hypothetical protein
MVIRSRASVGAALAGTALGLAALASCGVGHATTGDTSGPPSPAAATSATGPSTRLPAASPPAPAPQSGPETATSATGSGITGTSLVDGGCPVLRLDSPCPDHPIQARLSITDAGSGTVAATADTDRAGHFRIALPPGGYIVHAASPNGATLPRSTPISTTINSGQYTTLTIRFDSGIR